MQANDVASETAQKQIENGAINGSGTESLSRTRGLMPPWQPGQSGNPAGGKKKPLTERLIQRLMEDGEVEKAKVVEALLLHAHSGSEKTASASVKAITEIFDRVEGKVPQAVTGEAGGPLEIVLTTHIIGR